MTSWRVRRMSALQYCTAFLMLAVLMAVACSEQSPISTATPTTSGFPPAPSTISPSKTPADRGSGGFFRFWFGTQREVLSFCVDGAGGLAVTDADVEHVQQGADSIIAALGDGGYLGWIAEAQVVQDCPPALVPLGTANIVRVASEHRVFVYFLSDDVYSDTFSDAPYARQSAEICCMTGNDAEVTTSIFVTRSIQNGKMGEALMHAIGFQWYCAPGDVCPTRAPT